MGSHKRRWLYSIVFYVGAFFGIWGFFVFPFEKAALFLVIPMTIIVVVARILNISDKEATENEPIGRTKALSSGIFSLVPL
jgi:hypothetical protein